MSWYLTKDWVDQDDDIQGVLLSYTWSPLGHDPDWGANTEQRWLQDLGGSPRRRAKVLKLPRGIWHPSYGWVRDFALHHRFDVVTSGGEHATQTFTEEIASAELDYVDHDGLITNICVHWAVGDWRAPNYSPMEDPRIPTDHEFASVRYYGYEDKPRYHATKAHLLSRLELPHRWRARIWGPRGVPVLQQFHVGRMWPEHEQGESFLGPDGPTGEFDGAWVHRL